MSIARCCPYSDEKENCKFEIYSGFPRFDKCSTCERFLKQKFPDIDTSKFNIDENGNVLRDKGKLKAKRVGRRYKIFLIKLCLFCENLNK